MLSLLNPVGSPCGTSILGRSEDLETREGGRAEVGRTERESAKNRVEVVIERWTDVSGRGRGTEVDALDVVILTFSRCSGWGILPLPLDPQAMPMLDETPV